MTMRGTDASCSWPSDFINSTWIDSLKGDIIFDTSYMSGWSFSVQIQEDASLQLLDQWECVTYDPTGPYLIMKTVNTFIQFVTLQYTGYRCLKLEKITDASYRYYQMEPVQGQLSYERIISLQDSTVTDVSTLCEHPQVIPASGSEFQVMIKKGYDSVAKITCPYNLLIDYTFTYVETSDTSSSCGTTDSGTIDLCSNITMIQTQNPQCSAYPLYSDSAMMCVDVVTVDDDTFISLYNYLFDSSNINTNIQQFTCIGIDANRSSMSVTSKHCKANQSPTEVPVTNANQPEGSVLSLTSTGAPCPELQAPSKGTVTISTNGAITTANFTCDGNNTLSGNQSRICQDDGTWSGQQPSCTCPLIISPENGSVSISTDGLTATFTCDAGFILSGPYELSCDVTTNLWDTYQPVCHECQQLSVPTSGTIDISSTGLTSIANYTCNIGTTLFGDSTRVCQQDLTWTLSPPTCTSCSTLSSINSGNITLTTSGTVTMATYTCNTGYILIGNNISQCTPSGSWSSSEPSCLCVSPSVPTNGSVILSANLSMVTYSCDLGFTINGPEVRYCETDGTGWTSLDPTCTLCESITPPNNGSVTTSSNGTFTTVIYSCDTGFTMNGSDLSVCLSNGSWSTDQPSCNECNNLPTISNGSFTFSTNGVATYAEYTCDVGTTINGDVMVTCDANGEWSVTSANTSCVKCPDLSQVTGGTLSLSTNGTFSTAEYTCDSNYEIQGETTIRCLSNGTWSTVEPHCVLIASADAATENQSENKLLPAVIAMSVVIGLLIIGLVVAGIYIHKLKKSHTADTSKKNDESTLNGGVTNGPRPPMYHGASIMEFGSKFNGSPAPFSHSHTSRANTVLSNTPRSMQSALSAGSLNFDLVRETTTSSVFTDHPAPWNNNSLKHIDHVKTSPNGTFPSIYAHKTIIPEVRNSPNNSNSPRKKKKSFGKKHQQTKSNNRDMTETNQLNDPNMSRDSSRSSGATSDTSFSLMQNKHVSGSKKVLASRSGIPDYKVPRLNLRETRERASTPIKHYMEVKDPDKIETPRSNTFTTVQ
ncbi:hypothetical protein ACF0H5_010180 [Mactra antiquata]